MDPRYWMCYVFNWNGMVRPWWQFAWVFQWGIFGWYPGSDAVYRIHDKVCPELRELREQDEL